MSPAGQEPTLLMGPERAIAELRRADGRSAGLAFAIGPRYLVTCAHVINVALSRELRASDHPGQAAVWLEFPFGGSRDDRVKLQATVVSWLADRGRFDLHDVAVLQIYEDLPVGVTILSLTDVDPRGPVQMWGPAEGRELSCHVSGRLMGSVDKSRLQINQKLQGVFRVRTGFSGGPVWHPATGKVVGVLQAASVDDKAADAYVLGADLIGEACRDLPNRDLAPRDPTITVLHLSGLRFGAHLRLENEHFIDRAARPEELADMLLGDLKSTRVDSGAAPDLVVVAGNLAENAKPAEYEMAYLFLRRLRDGLRLEPNRLTVVPGEHDVNRRKCEAYFLDREAEDESAAPPYWPKWEPYAAMFTRFYGTEFRMDQPWQCVQIPELNIVVAGLNSTMAQSHHDIDNYGWLGPEQAESCARRLAWAKQRHWFRIGVLHHSPALGPLQDRTHLRDADLFGELIAPELNLVLYGQPSNAIGSSEGTAPAAFVGCPSTPLGAEAALGPLEYQLVEIGRENLQVRARRYDTAHHRWLSIGEDRPRRRAIAFAQVDAALPATTSTDSLAAEPIDRWDTKSPSGERDRGDLLSRMAEVCRLRLPQANVRIVRPPDGASGYLHVGVIQELTDGRRVPVEQYPVGACEGSVSDSDVDHFIASVSSRYLVGVNPVTHALVYDGSPAEPEVRERALRRGVELLSFAEYQLGYDLRPYAQWQAEYLARDSAYLPDLYVAQRYTEIDGYRQSEDPPIHEDLLDRIRGWLAEPNGHLVVVLGAFGHGKTFLLRELTRRMHEESDPAVPVLVHLRDLEKAHDLNQLVAAQLTAGGERRIDLAMFRYLLSQGRIALLFDGFDELAVRVTYDAAAHHLDKILQAVEGKAKVVLASRDQHFLTDAEVFSALGDRLTTVAGRRLVKLANFNDNQIAAFLRNRLGGPVAATRRLEILRNVEDLLGLSRNPRMLDFITKIPEDRLLKVRQRTGEITAAKLYEELLAEWLEYELHRRRRPDAHPPPTSEQFWHAVTSLALRLWSSAEEGIGIAALGETADEVARLAAPDSAQETAHDDRDETVHTIGSGTLLVRDSEGRFTFIHRSVMEWLVARHIANRIINHEPLPEPERREMSPLMVDFLCGLLGRDRASAWAASLLGDPSTAKGVRENALLVHKRLGLDIVSGRLAGSNLRGEDLSGQVLRNAHLADTDLTEAILVDTDLTGANLERASLVRARLDRSRLVNAVLRDADLTGASLLGADLTGADLTGSTLLGVALVGSKISSDSLSRANVTWGMAPPAGDLPDVQYRSRAVGMRAAAAGLGLIAAGGDDGVLRTWDTTSGSSLREWAAHSDEVLSLDFTTDGRWIASGGAGGAVKIWDAASGTLVREIAGHTGRVWSVGFSADGRRLASAGGDGVVKIWDTSTGTLEHALTGHIFVVWSVNFSADGRWLASAGDGQIVRLWNPDTGSLEREWVGHSSAVLCLGFSGDGKLASAGADGAVRIWEPDTGALLRELNGHTGPVWSLAFAPDGQQVASAGDDRVVRIWDPNNGDSIRELTGHTDEINSVDYSPDGRWLISSGTDRRVRVWDPATGFLARKWVGHTDEINSVGFSSDGRWLAAVGDDRVVRIWNPATGALQNKLTGHTGRIWSMAFCPGGRWLASAGADGLVRIWDLAMGTLEHELTGHTGRVRCLRFAPDKSRLASSGDDRLIRLWDPVAGTLEREWTGHAGRVRSLAYTRDGRKLASGGDDGMVRIWDAATGTLEREWIGHVGAVWAVWYSPDGSRLAVGGTVGKVSILDSTTGKLEREWTSHTGAVSAVAFSPDGHRLVSAGTVGIIRVWEPGSGTELGRLRGHTGAVWSVGFSPDGRWLASVGSDGVVRIWDVVTASLRTTLISLTDGWAALGANLSYKLYGHPTGEYWYTLGLCRFEPGELDPYIPAIRRVPREGPCPGLGE